MKVSVISSLSFNIFHFFQTKLTNLQKEKEKEVKALLTRCQESEKTKLLEEKSEASGDKNKIKQLTAEAKKLNVRNVLTVLIKTLKFLNNS